ncbi:hypothetical protein LTR36_008448 [Oleoguttula mirabilis]|uniref:Uncharacterized protein n=1 Tax=Oleoguttula mirabilis TaxID=1507867 RepID=A0AAV9J809_9PEZI|nr:hypothetical protein LTR36_008448 [Oleoguttula mirabilis]
MPMIWNAEADAKLMATVLQVCDVKLTQQHYDVVAKTMGCTPKALKHRMQKIRNAGKEGQDDDDDAGEDTAKTKPVKAAKATKAAVAAGGKKKVGSGGGKKQAARTPSPAADDEEQADGALTPPPSNRPKRGGSKRDYAQLAGEDGSDDEEDGDGMGKKVKIEVGEDIGEGLRMANEGEEGDEGVEAEEMDGAGFFT